MFVLNAQDVAGLAARLEQADRAVSELDPLTVEYPGLEVAQAYDIQAELLRLKQAKGERVVGYKMGLTSKAKMEQMGVHSPIFGVLTDRMIIEDAGEFPMRGSIHPRIEPEVAFRIGKDLRGRPTAQEALAACSNACAAMEIIDSRFKAFKFKLADVVADNCSCRAFVLGTWQPVPTFDQLAELPMNLSIDGRNVRNGSSSHILGNPANSLALLCSMLEERGLGLKRGSVVLAGAATEAVALEAGKTVTSDVDRLGSVGVSIR